jgi:hypothetical protein
MRATGAEERYERATVVVGGRGEVRGGGVGGFGSKDTHTLFALSLSLPSLSLSFPLSSFKFFFLNKTAPPDAFFKTRVARDTTDCHRRPRGAM